MAPPHSESIVTAFPRPSPKTTGRPPRLSNDNLKRSISDIAYELSKEIDRELSESSALPPISEAEDAKCECCGMSEEYTPEYIKRVRDNFAGKWICGLCTEAVKEEKDKNGGSMSHEEAIDTHMNQCARFNRLGRAYPVLCQAEAMREILKKSSKIRAKSTSPRDAINGHSKKGGITRSYSCISAITKDVNNLKLNN